MSLRAIVNSLKEAIRHGAAAQIGILATTDLDESDAKEFVATLDRGLNELRNVADFIELESR